jgi:type I restriction enzyme S subunit
MKCSTLIDTQDHITERAVTEASMTVYPPNSIAIVTRSGILKHTFPVCYVPFATTINQDIKMLVVKDGILPRYAFHAIQGKGRDILSKTKKQGGTVDSLDFQRVLDYKIPLPSLEVQQRLVNVLDNFDAICSDLNIGLPAEIEARQKQYEYYRDMLLTFAETGPTIMTDRQTDRQTDNRSALIRLCQYVFGYVSVELGYIGKVSMCKRIMKAETSSVGDVPFFKIGTFGKEPDAYISREKFEEYKATYSYPNKGDILISAAGTIGRTVVFDGEDAYYQDSNIVWIANDESIVLNRYLYYCYQLQPWNVSTGGTIARLYNDNISKARIPVPPIEEQNHIVSILDRLDALCNDLSSGLPAEIEARTKQYEYYRDKLLSFTPAE